MTLPMDVLLTSLTGMFLLMGLGFLLARFRLLPEGAGKILTAYLMQIALPATVFCSMLRPLNREGIQDSVTIVLLFFAAYLAFVGLSKLLAKPLGVKKGSSGVWRYCCCFGNNAFVGYPLLLAVLGQEGQALGVIGSVAYNIMIFTAGVGMIRADNPALRAKGAGPVRRLLEGLRSPMNAGLFAGVIVYLFQIPLPEFVTAPANYLAGATTGLSMLISGMNLANSNFLEIIRDRDAVTASLLRLLVFPLLAYIPIRFLPGVSDLVKTVAVMMFAMPVPMLASVFAGQYEVDQESAAHAVLLSSLLCIVTIPLVTMLL